MKTILVPTDFSEAASNAAEYAVNMAKAIHAKILLLHVYHLPLPSSEVSMMDLSPAELQKENEADLRKEAARLKKKNNNVEITYKAKMGLAVDQILEEEKSANLIIMGINGTGKWSEALMGSVATATLRKATTPVLIIPENAVYKKPEKIVFACDFNPQTEVQTLDRLKKFLSVFSPKIYVVNVREKQVPVSLEEAATGVQLENELNDVAHVYSFPENKDIVEGVSQFVNDHGADMVAVIPHRYGLIDRLFHSSISKKMAFYTHVPLLGLPENHKSISAFFL